jgi:hypothetical protein
MLVGASAALLIGGELLVLKMIRQIEHINHAGGLRLSLPSSLFMLFSYLLRFNSERS